MRGLPLARGGAGGQDGVDLRQFIRRQGDTHRTEVVVEVLCPLRLIKSPRTISAPVLIRLAMTAPRGTQRTSPTGALGLDHGEREDRLRVI
ncbi:MAG TPA: hypothetical protein VKA15_16490 [Isosphaeraceae bacterium]|nr:hypothetical protein [Isosphaeraceae bacterium]